MPIALGILAASGQTPTEPLSRYEFFGELALTGELWPIHSALAMASSMMRDTPNLQNKVTHQKRAFILPQNSAAEAVLVKVC